MANEYAVNHAGEYRAQDSVQERWSDYLGKRPNLEGVLEVDLTHRTAVMHPADPDRQPVEFHGISDEAYRTLMRDGIGAAAQSNVLEMPVVSAQGREGVLTWASVAADDRTQANLPNLSGTVNDLSLESQLGWKAAGMALEILDSIKADQQENYMSGNGPGLHPVKESIKNLMGEIEEELAPDQLHKDHEYLVAAQVLAILDATHSRAETGGVHRLADGRNRIANLRALCAQREEAMAKLDGGDGELLEAQDRNQRAQETLAQTRANLKRSGIATAIATR